MTTADDSQTEPTPIAFCRSMPPDIWKRHPSLMKSPLMLLALVFFWCVGLFMLFKNTGLPPVLSVAFVSVALLGFYLITKLRRYHLDKRLTKKGLPIGDLGHARFIVIDDPANWHWPTGVPRVNFELRTFPARLHTFWTWLPLAAYLLPVVFAIIVDDVRIGNYISAIVFAVLLLSMTILPMRITRFEILPGQFRTIEARRFGRASFVRSTQTLRNAKLVADLIHDRILILTDGDQVDFRLHGIEDKREFVYYLMLASRARNHESRTMNLIDYGRSNF